MVRSFKVSDGQVVSFANGTEFDHETGIKILSLGTCQKLAGGEGGVGILNLVRKLGDPSLQWE